MTSWKPEDNEQFQAQNPLTEYKIKAHLVLEGSDRHDWGIVKDCHGRINYIPEDAEVVGTWNKYGEGIFWVSLTTATEALLDRMTQLTAELAKKRLEVGSPVPTKKTKGTRTRASKVEKAEEAKPTPDPLFSSLRAKLGR